MTLVCKSYKIYNKKITLLSAETLDSPFGQGEKYNFRILFLINFYLNKYKASIRFDDIIIYKNDTICFFLMIIHRDVIFFNIR